MIKPALLAAAMVICCLNTPLRAVQVQDLVRLKGSENSKIVGMGLVVGLNGTGDGGKFVPAMRQLATAIQNFGDPNTVAIELKSARNVALVMVTATLPASGVREGDRVDVAVSAIGEAKSLLGGRLFITPLIGPVPGAPVYAFAEGPINIEDVRVPTTGVVQAGAQLTKDVMSQCVVNGRITLVLNTSVATWTMASFMANLINGEMAPDGPEIARAIDAKNVIVELPPADRANPATFISRIMIIYIDPRLIGTGARVVINERTGTIVISGEVEISPVIISHKGLTITTITPPPPPDAVAVGMDEVKTFVGMDPNRHGGARLADLLGAFNQLKVDAQDRIAIIKEINRSGKLHAQLIIE